MCLLKGILIPLFWKCHLDLILRNRKIVKLTHMRKFRHCYFTSATDGMKLGRLWPKRGIKRDLGGTFDCSFPLGVHLPSSVCLV